MSNKYNGWTNYETWNANLWIDNDWRLSEHIALITADCFGSYEDLDTITGLVAERIIQRSEFSRNSSLLCRGRSGTTRR